MAPPLSHDEVCLTLPVLLRAENLPIRPRDHDEQLR